MARACSPIPTAYLPPSSFTSKGELAQTSKGGCNLISKYKPHVVSRHSSEAPTTANRNFTQGNV